MNYRFISIGLLSLISLNSSTNAQSTGKILFVDELVDQMDQALSCNYFFPEKVKVITCIHGWWGVSD